jgi:hypothetical protein
MLLVATKQSYWGFFFHAIATLITFNHVACCHVAKLLGFLFPRYCHADYFQPCCLLPRSKATGVPFQPIATMRGYSI